MFPRHILEQMILSSSQQLGISRAPSVDIATSHDHVTIMFMDIVGFTTMSKEVKPVQVMEFLNSLFTRFDDLVDQYDAYKVSSQRKLFCWVQVFIRIEFKYNHITCESTPVYLSFEGRDSWGLLHCGRIPDGNRRGGVYGH